MGDPVFLPVNPKVHSLFVANAAVAGLTILVVALRVFARIHFTAGLGLDDYCVLASVPLTLAMLVITRYFSRLWIGQHIWDISPSNYPLIRHLFLTYQILYVAAVGLQKLSLLLFYLRVFVQPWIRRWCKAFMILLALGETAMAVHPPLICRLYSKSAVILKCVDLHISAIILAAWSVVTDIAVLMLPIPALMALQASRKRKIGLIAVFLIGLFAVVVAASRVYTLFKAYEKEHSNAKVHDTAFTSIWSDFLACLEPHVNAICISLPTLGPIVKRCMCKPKCQATSNSTSGQQLSNYSGRKQAHRGAGISMVELCSERYRADARSESGSETALAPAVE